MKKFLYISSIIIFFGTMPVRLWSQDTTLLHVSGHIYDDVNFLPVPAHAVQINVYNLPDTAFLVTDMGGYFEYSFVLPADTQAVSGFISTLDCNQATVTEMFTWSPSGTGVYKDLFICNGNTPPDSLMVITQGHITAEFTGNPVPFHEVTIVVQVDPVNSYTATVQTDTSGYYMACFLLNGINLAGTATITTLDCNQQIHQQIHNWNEIDPVVTADFAICTESAPCQADFIINYEEGSTVNFTANATGNIDAWFWDFGDGTFADIPLITHTFPCPGNFTVCLTVVDYEQGMVLCSDTICYDVFIPDPLQANFISWPDTLGGINNFHYFVDLTTGDPDSWFWDFGDDTYSTLQNPDHQYMYSGTFNACLTVSRTNPNGTTTTSTWCVDIYSPGYFNLGGAAFAGDHPINNPYPEGDTGMAILYRFYPDQIIAADTNIFSEYGYFWFTGVREGNYLLKVQLTQGSNHFAVYLPTYHGNSLNWYNSGPFFLSDSSNYSVNIGFRTISGLETGQGLASGIVLPGYSEGISGNVEGVTIILEDENFLAVAYLFSDENGAFEFKNLPWGTYYLYAESAGYYGERKQIILGPTNPQITGLELTMDQSWIGINEPAESVFRLGEIYPNPVRQEFTLKIYSHYHSSVSCSITDLTGRVVKNKVLGIPDGITEIDIMVDDIEPGIYLLNVYNNHKVFFTEKLVKVHP